MTDALDPRLKSLFAEEPQVLDDGAFTDGVIARAKQKRYRVLAGLAAVIVAMVASALFFALPIQGLAQFIAETLTISLVDLGVGWAAFVLAPINNIASVMILGTKAALMWRKKIINASYVN